jgi:hypothetical protein
MKKYLLGQYKVLSKLMMTALSEPLTWICHSLPKEEILNRVWLTTILIEPISKKTIPK